MKTKIQQAIDIVNKRLPSSYLSKVKVFKTCSQMLRWYCDQEGKHYKKRLQWYDDYLNEDKTNTYIKTKYWRELKLKKNKTSCFWNYSNIL